MRSFRTTFSLRLHKAIFRSPVQTRATLTPPQKRYELLTGGDFLFEQTDIWTEIMRSSWRSSGIQGYARKYHNSGITVLSSNFADDNSAREIPVGYYNTQLNILTESIFGEHILVFDEIIALKKTHNTGV